MDEAATKEELRPVKKQLVSINRRRKEGFKLTIG